MTKAVPYIIFGVFAAYYAYRTIRKALNEPPEEERCYSSSVAAIIDGANQDEEWLYTDMDEDMPY